MTFAKIIKATDGHDVLFYKRSGDDGEPVIAVVLQHEGTTATMELGYDDDDAGWDKRDHEFERMDQQKADGFRKALLEMVRS